jgi:hypothetical protein
MPRAVPVPLRLRLFELADQGRAAADIASALDLVPRTVRRLLAQRQRLAAEGFQPAYHRCGRQPQLCQQAIDLRREHPTWGVPYIRVVLEETTPTPLPSTRTLQRHLAHAGLQPAPAGRPPRSQRRRAQAPHEIWQLDGCERLPLRTLQEVSWVRLVDEYTGAFLGTRVFPLGSFQQVPAQQTQRFLREQFTLWGRPALLRVDNGTPWGASGGLPTALQMWAAGAGVDMHHNDACCPQQNGGIERSHGTNKRWAEPWLCDSDEQLQRRSDEAAVRQRERYPYRGGKSRLEVFPGLRHSGRPYDADWEGSNWSLELATVALAEAVEVRKVDQSGHVAFRLPERHGGRSLQ